MHHSRLMPYLVRFAASFTCGMVLFIGSASADALKVEPQQLSLSSANPVGNLKFSNSSPEERILSFRVVEWQQEHDREWFTPSGKLMVVPERMTLRPGETAEARVVLRLSASWWEEQAFRIMVTETFRVPDMGDNNGHAAGARVTRPSSLPVFLEPPDHARPQISWSLKSNSEGEVFLRASNQGTRHMRLTSASLLGPAGQSIQKTGMSEVILPGGSGSWKLSAFPAAGSWQLDAVTSIGRMQVDLELDPENATARALSYSQQ